MSETGGSFWDGTASALNGLVNALRATADDMVKANAEFASSSGLTAKIVRSTSGESCSWCSSIAGTYDYGSEPKDVYRRHDNCDCTVEYVTSKGSQNVHSKQWTRASEADKIGGRKTVGLEGSKTDTAVAFNKRSQFSNMSDPAYDLMGSAYDSNPDEIKEIQAELKKIGVTTTEGSNLSYGSIREGSPGGISITREASYSAWLHELQHMEDDRAAGWNASRVLWCDRQECIDRETRAYQREIDYISGLTGIGDADKSKTIEQLEENLKNGIKDINKRFDKLYGNGANGPE